MQRSIRRDMGLLILFVFGGLCLLPVSNVHAQTTCTQFGVVSSANARLKYQNNFYNPTSGSKQCLHVNDVENGGFYISNDAVVATNGPPSAYASVFMGCQWSNCSNPALSQLPAQLSDLGLAHSSWSVAPTPSGAWDISYDIWFNQTPSTSGQPDGTEVMIWLDDHGGIRPAESMVDNVTIDGINFDVYVAPKNSQSFNAIWNVVSYRATTLLHVVDFSLMPFFNDAVNRGQLQRSWWLIAVEAGFEAWSGADGLASHAFSFSLY